MKRNRIRIIGLTVVLIALTAFYLHKPKPQEPAAKAGASSRFLTSIHYQMDTPAEMNTTKEGRDFTWITDNGAGIMRNICLYSYPAERLDSSVVISRRDSVMRLNIPGETDGMYVETDSRMPVRHTLTPEGRLRTEGTWEMKGDMMGGPFVCHSIYDPQNRRVIVAEAFLFAPDRDKATAMKRLEEILFTLRPAE